ncbi:MAG: HD domain-containing protein [Acidimicrobiia bacterium]
MSHALQCGAILGHDYPDDLELAVAGLLHDISDAVTPGDHTDHDLRGARLVRPLFGERVAKLVGAHVLAKRYLITVDSTYRSELNDRSAETLVEQGGILGATELELLDRDPALASILALRRADERAKDPSRVVPGLEVWQPILEAVAYG